MHRYILLLLLFLSSHSKSIELEPYIDCTFGQITINGTIVGTGIFCDWAYRVINQDSAVIGEDDDRTGGGTPISQQCFDHQSTFNQLPDSCKHFVTGAPPNFDWSTYFLNDFRDMLCSVASCSNAPLGAFNSQGDNLASRLLREIGTALWTSWNATQMINIGMPIIQSQCNTLPENLMVGYDQHDCYQDALNVLNEINPNSYSLGINWLTNITIGGSPVQIDVNPNAQMTNYGALFANRIAEFRHCNLWHNRRIQLCGQ